MIKGKECLRCGLVLPLGEFEVVARGGSQWRRNVCDECRRKAAREYRVKYYQLHKEEMRQKRKQEKSIPSEKQAKNAIAA